MELLRHGLHYSLHLLLPGAIAKKFFPDRWKQAWGVMLLTLLVDLDHLLADPVYDPSRCSIGHHPLHTLPAVGVYLLLLLFPCTRIAGIGLVLHMLTDFLDCLWL